EAEEAAAETAGTGIGLSAVLIYIGLALLPPLAWYIRAYWLTGNPVYPLTFWGLFPGPELPVYAETSWVDQFYERSPFSALTYPFALTIGRSLLDRYQAHLPFQWLLGVPLAWVWRGRSPVVRWWTWLLVATLVAMYRIAPRETRYMLFAVPWLALLTGLGLMLLFRAIPRQVIATALGLVILGGPLIWNQTEVPEALRQTLPVIVKRESRGKYIGRAAPVTGAIARMNRELPADAFVFCLEDRMYRMERDWTNYYAATEPFPQTAEESYTFCYRQGVTHLFLGDGTITHPTIFRNIVDLPPDADGITRFTQGHVMFNIIGDPIDPTKHWVAWFTTRRALQRAGFESRINAEGIEEFSIAHDRLLSTPVQQAHYNVINAIEEMVRRGWLKVLYNNGLTMILEYDYSAIAAYEDPGHFGVGRPKSP
ncbi:MAG TPA: hypothetical protein VEI97_04825, partial [bacterium]|nr:hypothetical protein [bacterium]